MFRIQATSAKFVLACGLALVFSVAHDSAWAFTTLHSFQGGADGANPAASLIMDKAGNLYGTTVFGANTGCNGNTCGSIFELAPSGTQTILESFGSDADMPEAGLLRKSGNLYCTTSSGGANGSGAVFRMTLQGKETILHAFTGGNDGGTPLSTLIADAAGNLYGTASQGGTQSGGTIFKIAPDGTETTLHSFGTDGFRPQAGLISDAAGNFYGTTSGGGTSGLGTIFELAADGTYSALYSFGSQTSDGYGPLAAPIRDASGNLYGTTGYGGAGCSTSCGTVFRLAPNGQETVLYSFLGGNDARHPVAGLVRDANGNLYGTTEWGSGSGCGGLGCGTVFRLAPDGTETLLHVFTGGSDGGEPTAALIAKGSTLYGTTSTGGANGFGTVFTLKE